MKFRREMQVVLVAAAFMLSGLVQAQPLAFPGAEGFGKHTTGGRGGRTIIVSNLNDSGEGSLRKAIQANGPRVVVFSVSGTIALESPLDINKGDITIAGQSAPGDGITIKNYPVSIKSDNVIIRYMRFRLGDEAKVEGDALSATKGNANIIIDHCSISWATDECASFYRNTNFTFQWSIVSESLKSSVHKKGEHGYGGIWGGRGASFHHNLIASHMSRTPRFSGSSTTPNSEDELVDFRNNVIYNWQINSVYGGEKGKYNIVNNYYKPGPATPSSKKDRLVNPTAPFGRFYVEGNHLEGNEEVSKNNRAKGGIHCTDCEAAIATEPFAAAAVSTSSAAEAYTQVLAGAGASLKRDAVDQRLIEEVGSGKSASGNDGDGLIDSQKDVGGWPSLKSFSAPLDTDKDGMPDFWELKQGLNPKDASDSRTTSLDSAYSNIEVYINQLVK